MRDDLTLRDTRIAFAAGFKIPDWSGWDELRGGSAAAYRWTSANGDDGRFGRPEFPCGDGDDPLLNDLRTVEEFYLNARSQIVIGEDRLELERCRPGFDLRVRSTDGDRTILDADADVVLTYYRSVDVLGVTLNFQLGETQPDDLIYLKSLKWDSAESIRGAREMDVSFDGGESWTQRTFQELFEAVVDEFFDAEFDPRTGGEAILDTISFRGIDIDRDLSQREENRVLYGLLTGDEGYDLNSQSAIDAVVNTSDGKLDTRSYFEYFFNGTTVLGRLDSDYGEVKTAFADRYGGRFGEYPPYDGYLRLDPEIAALEDGMYFLGEIALVRFVLLRDVDDELEKTLSSRRQFASTRGFGPDQEASLGDPFSIVARGEAIVREFFHDLSGRDLRELEETKRQATIELTNVDMLTNSVLGIGVIPSFDDMFNYRDTRTSVREKLEDIDDSIQYRYNHRTQTVIILLTLVTVLVTALTLLQ
jgi:hypothetical protein